MSIPPEVSLKIVRALLARTPCNEAEAAGAELALHSLSVAVQELNALKAVKSDAKP